MANDLLTFDNEDFGQIRILEKDGEFWFIAMDVCSILGLENISKAIESLDSDEKSNLSYLTNSNVINDFNDLRSSTRIVSESGLYALIFKSRKPEAKKFRKWVTSEVLPSIRKTGEYSVQKKLSRGKSWDEVQSKEIDINRLKANFESAMLEADLISKYSNEFGNSFISAEAISKMYVRKFGASPIKKLDYETKKILYSDYIIVTEIGECVTPTQSGKEINSLLKKKKYQKKNNDTGKWEVIGKGRKFGAYIVDYIDDEGKEHPKLRWHYSIIDTVQTWLDEVYEDED